MKPYHLIATSLLLSAAPLSAADSIELKQQWIAGKKYFQTMEMTQITSMTMGEKTMDQKMNMTSELSSAVTAHEDGQRKRLTMRYEHMAMTLDMAGQTMGFDSAKPAEDAMGIGKGIQPIIGKDIKILLSPQDEIQEIENYDEFIGALASGPGAAIVGKMFTKESLTEMVEQSTLKAMPGHPVKPGDSWTFNTSMKLPLVGDMEIKGTYTFKAMAPHKGIPCAEIAMAATLSLTADTTPADPKNQAPEVAKLKSMGMSINNGAMTGTLYFDPALGMARDFDMKQTMELSMKNPADPTATMTIPMKQDIQMELTKIEDLK
jgi:hypothetical protein